MGNSHYTGVIWHLFYDIQISLNSLSKLVYIFLIETYAKEYRAVLGQLNFQMQFYDWLCNEWVTTHGRGCFSNKYKYLF